MVKIIFIFFNSIYFANILAQPKVEVLTYGKTVSIRGLSVVNDSVLWVSGSNGSVGKSTDGGKTIDWKTVRGFEKADFRDIEAFDKNTAIIMAISEPANILKTIDGGISWKNVYFNNTKGMFLDAMDFEDSKNGIVIGDPIDGEFFIAKTSNSGDSWHEIPTKFQPTANVGEGAFASSGTNIKFSKNGHYYFVSGGKTAQLFSDIKIIEIPINQGVESTGGNSVALNKNKKRIIIVGGDFKDKDNKIDNCLISNNGGKSFEKSKFGPNGYRSCVEFISRKSAITCGLNGVDYSTDSGKTWLGISIESFHVCQKAKNGKAVYFAGTNGKIGKLILPK
jgi:photosystem II stability/assembly factor-like uncharacterized protein